SWIRRSGQQFKRRASSEPDGKALVRTFHSALLRAVKVKFPGIRFFETYGNKYQPRVAVQDSEDVENPFSTARLNETQTKLLKRIYIRLYSTDADFRSDVLEMLRLECSRDLTPAEYTYKYEILRKASDRDEDLVRKVNGRCKELGLWPST